MKNYIKKYKKEIISVLILMFIAGFLSLSQVPSDYMINNDGCSYADTAKNIVEGKGYTYMGEPNIVFPPVYPAFIAVFYWITGDTEMSGIYASSFAWILSVIPLFLIVRYLFNRRLLPVLLTMGIIVTSPELNNQARKVLSEATYLLFLYISVLLVMYFVIRKNSRKTWHYLLIGSIFSITFLTRPEGFVFMVLVSVYLICRQRKDLKIALRNAALIIVSFFIVAAPYLVYLSRNVGHFTLSGRVGITLVGGENIDDPDYKIKYEKNLYGITTDRAGVYMYRGMFFSIPKYFISNFGNLVHRFLFNFREYFISLFHILMPLGLILILALLIKGGEYDRKIFFFIMLLIIPIFANIFFFLIERYLYQYLVFILILSGIGLYKIGYIIRKKTGLNDRILIAGQIILILLMHLSIFLYYLHPYKDRAVPWNEHKELGIWMAHNIEDIENKVVVSRKAFVPFYAGAIYKALPWVENRFELFHYLDNVKADYLVVDTRYFRDLRPRIYYLLETERHYKPIELAKVIERKNEKIVLYKFKDY